MDHRVYRGQPGRIGLFDREGGPAYRRAADGGDDDLTGDSAGWNNDRYFRLSIID